VHAKDLETGQQQSITVTASSGLTRDEITNMMEQSHDFAVARRTSEESEQAKQEAERLIAEIEKLFPQVERVVAGSDFGRDAIDKARGVVARARALMEAGDATQLKEQLDALARTQRMFKGVVGKTA
jgi:molecular chaperone DnaK